MLKKIIAFFNKPDNRVYLRSFILGGLASLAFAPTYYIFFAFISFTSLLILVSIAQNRLKAFFIGWWFGLGHFMVGLYWITIAIASDPDFYFLLPFATLLVSAALACYVALVCWAFYYIISKYLLPIGGFAQISLFATLWLIAELLRSYLFSGFPWNLLGYVWGFSDNMIQTASVLGVYGLSAISIIVFASPTPLATYLIRKFALGHQNLNFAKALWPIMLALLLVCCMMFYGNMRLQNSKQNHIKDVKIRLVQANIDQHHKWDPELSYQSFQKYVNLTKSQPLDDITHIIWPETATPYTLSGGFNMQGQKKTLEALTQGLKEHNTIITGALRFKPAESKHKIAQYFNSIFAIKKQNGQPQILDYYDKKHLVPFGEYLPFASKILSIFPQLGEFSSLITVGFAQGIGKQTIELTDLVKFRPLICYESIFSSAILDKNQERPELLINITNDAWFGKSSAPYQHFDMARMRAAEYGIPLIRVANTGISALIDPYGRNVKRIGLLQSGILDVNLPTSLKETIYSKYQGRITISIIVFLLIITLLARINYRPISNNIGFKQDS